MVLKETIVNYMSLEPFGISYSTVICLGLAVLFSYFDIGFFLVKYWESRLSTDQAHNRTFKEVQLSNPMVFYR